MTRPYVMALAASVSAILVGCGGGTTAPPAPSTESGAGAPRTTLSHGTPPSAAPNPLPAAPAAPVPLPIPSPAPVVVAPPNLEALPVINGAVLLATITESAPANEFDENGKYYDYLWQPPAQPPAPDEPMEIAVPLGLPSSLAANVPASNPITRNKWELGRQLYFDPRLSKNGTVSCATCHNPEKGFTDQAPVSTGIHGQKGGRSAPTVINTVFGGLMFWDGRAPSLEGQSQGPPLNPIEMGYANYKELVERLRQVPGYQEQFRKVYGTEVTLDGMAKAIATFERTILSGNSAYDRYLAGDTKALSESQKRGMVLFGLRLPLEDDFQAEGTTLQKAKCTLCHVGFNFTDEKFHNLGVGYDEKSQSFADLGRWQATPIGAKSDGDIGAFKTPTLRNLKDTAPYLHDGSEKTLLDVVKFYNRGGNANRYLDKDMTPLNLTDQEMADVAAFLEGLQGEVTKVEVPALPPDADGKAPDARAALTPPKAEAAFADPHGALVR